MKCDPTCKDCSFNTSKNCTSCGGGRYLLNGECLYYCGVKYFMLN